jgi:pre-rRNA-processing protein RIX1
MAPMASELATLRALTFRISSTATSQLPQHVPAIAASLASCRTLLSSAQASTSKTASEASVAVHKYRTLLSTLLQDRSIQGRWAAIVLIKSTIEVGGWETLQKSLPWVRGLLGILTKPDPFSSKQLCIITLTRIFFLTREYPSLIREITTPSLSPFIQSALQIAASKSSPALLETVLESFNQLLPRHPTTFRSHLKGIHQLLNRTIAPTPSSKLGHEQPAGARSDVTPAVSEAARRLYTQLPCSAPKGAAAEEWQKSFRKAIENAHRLGDKVFRAVVEDWKSSARETATANGHTLDDEVQDLTIDAMFLPPWSGMFAGVERLLGLLSLIKTYILSPTTMPVGLNIGTVVDLLTRLLSLTISSAKGQGFQNAIKFNNQVSKEERDNLWLVLPEIHVAAIDLLLALIQRSDASTTAIDAAMLDQIVWVFASEKDSPEICTACYTAVAELLQRSGIALPKSSIDPLGDMIRRCCDDILPLETNGTQQSQSSVSKTNSTPQATTNADAFLKAPKATNVSGNFVGLQNAARTLLPILFTHIRPQHLSDSLRARLDRTAILVRDKDAMIASVLNPPPSRKFGKPTASILPFLARHQSGEKDVEALLRPRMPVIRTGTHELEGVDEDEEEESEEEEEMPEEFEGDDEFVGNELDTLLETARTSDAGDDVAMAEVVDIAVATSAPLTLNDRPATSLESANAVGKRPQEDSVSLSSPKRVKVSEEQEQLHVATLPVQTSAAVPTTVVAPKLEVPTVVPDLPATSQALAHPVLAAPAAPSKKAGIPAEQDSDDDDDDDKISLVLGQDTDSESE